MKKLSVFFCLLFLRLCAFDKWEMTDYIWNWGLVSSLCKNVPQPQDYFQDRYKFDSRIHDFSKNAVVWVKSGEVEKFTLKVLPFLKHPIVLIVNIGDESFPDDCFHKTSVETLLENKKIRHVFAQNCVVNHPKVTPIPIGICFHTVAYSTNGAWGEIGSPSEQEEVLKDILSRLQPTHLRKKRAFVDFQLNNTMRQSFHRNEQWGEDREIIFQKLVKTGLIDYSGLLRRSELWKKKGQYAFSISPPGNGLDTHRTWEDLTLGCIVIVKSSPLDRIFDGLPVVIVKDWSEITEENMNKWLDQYVDAFTNPRYREKLFNAYWVNLIRSKCR
jgi:hypothetical protein